MKGFGDEEAELLRMLQELEKTTNANEANENENPESTWRKKADLYKSFT